MSQKILIVEDEPASLRILRYFLSCEGYETAGAKDGVEAMELLGNADSILCFQILRCLEWTV